MEVEIKLNVRPAIEGGPVMFFTKLVMLTDLAGLPLGPIQKVEIRDIYYDTADGALAKSGAGLRLRVQNGDPYVTLKINKFQDGSLTQREEYQELLTQERLDWVLSHVREQIGDGEFPYTEFAAGKGVGTLVPVLDVGTARLVRTVGKVAELTLDMVEYHGVSANPYFDIEIEAVGGAGGEKVLRTIETHIHTLAGGDVAPATESKLERGLRLKERIRK